MYVFCFQPVDGSIESPSDNRSTTIDIQKEPSPLTVEVTPCDTHGNDRFIHRVTFLSVPAVLAAMT